MIFFYDDVEVHVPRIVTSSQCVGTHTDSVSISVFVEALACSTKIVIDVFVARWRKRMEEILCLYGERERENLQELLNHKRCFGLSSKRPKSVLGIGSNDSMVYLQSRHFSLGNHGLALSLGPHMSRVCVVRRWRSLSFLAITVILSRLFGWIQCVSSATNSPVHAIIWMKK